MDSYDPTRDFPSEDGIPGISGTTEPSKFLTTEYERRASSDTWDRRALAHVKEHLESEETALDVYTELRARATGAVAYLIDLILADEARHHQLFSDLVQALTPPGRVVPEAGSIESLISTVPQPSMVSEEDRVPMLRQTNELLKAEREDQRALKQLQRELRPVRTETIWPLLVEMMEFDTEKHITMLRRIEQLLSN